MRICLFYSRFRHFKCAVIVQTVAHALRSSNRTVDHITWYQRSSEASRCMTFQIFPELLASVMTLAFSLASPIPFFWFFFWQNSGCKMINTCVLVCWQGCSTCIKSTQGSSEFLEWKWSCKTWNSGSCGCCCQFNSPRSYEGCASANKTFKCYFFTIFPTCCCWYFGQWSSSQGLSVCHHSAHIVLIVTILMTILMTCDCLVKKLILSCGNDISYSFFSYPIPLVLVDA